MPCGNTIKLPVWALALCLAASASAGSQPQGENANAVLKSCPDSPNCVSSMAPQGKHYIAPIACTGDRRAVWNALVKILQSSKRTRLVVRQKDYIHAEVASALFGFVDDVEFVFSENMPIIDVRSASRTGYYDFGVNRRRIEALRKRLARIAQDTREPV